MQMHATFQIQERSLKQIVLYFYPLFWTAVGSSENTGVLKVR